MAYLATLKDKRIGVLGLGFSGLACVSYLLHQGCIPFVMDGNMQSTGVKQIQTHWPQVMIYPLPDKSEPDKSEPEFAAIPDADLLIVSPGIPLSAGFLTDARNRHIEIIGDVELFARINRKPVIAITGSNGKSTVTKLVTQLLQNGGYNALCGGNIGIPVLDLLSQPFDIAVLELSSFQLETTQSLHAETATILNVNEDHMDRYKDMAAYVEAKQRIYNHADIAVYNAADEFSPPPVNHPSQVPFGLNTPQVSLDNPLQSNSVGIRNGCFAIAATVADGTPMAFCTLDTLALIGQHNVLNALAALALVAPFKLSGEVIEKTFATFTGLPHRCERIAGTGEVIWVNDSKATNVGATVAALKGIKAQIRGKLILLAGGVGKSADFSPLQQALHSHVDQLITFGQDGEKIAALMPGAGRVNSLEAAVLKAFALANPGDCVLLSPACASFDMFSSFEARGTQFVALVKEICHDD